ncbi:alcohol dehydrogenase [Pseudoalteromonas lipolytica SCSIO 04301]|uniref:zinc-binding dehydrogenase n=1 Tax=Pseudoalteromonas lipolytica TaxID=570156 RepID=UPI0004455F54|nr:zinc-binding dehydrogenase [Pseudoalteromonas lipolytica]EWH06168.1 alcohol dehydrogenase [Pseudoalteromonas lipolytica SCSIO 04301]
MSQMNSVAMQNGQLHVKQIAIPTPGPGQVLVKSLACGICGSDIHITRHTSDVFDIYKNLGIMDKSAGNDQEVLLGHEYAAEIVSYGPDTKGELAAGTRVTSVPILMSAGGAGVGVTPGIYGAYSEYFIVDEALLLPIPDGVPSEAAAITEPLAVGLHAVNRANMSKDDVAVVVGCGPIGLAAIAALKLQGVKHIVASDPQESKKQIALEFGATHYVNPMADDEVTTAATLAGDHKVVIFECAGVSRLLNDYILRAPAKAKIIVTGIHTAPLEVNFAYATVKELDLIFSYYYQPEEFAQSLENIASGKIAWQKMRTGKVGIDGVQGAFDTLFKPNDHIKIIIEPWRTGALEKVTD